METLMDTAIYRDRHADYYRDQPHDLSRRSSLV